MERKGGKHESTDTALFLACTGMASAQSTYIPSGPAYGPWASDATFPQPQSGSPAIARLLERVAKDAHALDGWPGLLVGDMPQPRGRPMVTGHSNHQIGLDVDIWLTPIPHRILTLQERENITAVSMLKGSVPEEL